MYVCCSRDIQNMKEKRGTYWRLFKDQWSSLSLVRARRSWAEWQNCLSKGSRQSTSRHNYRLWQFSASSSKTPCFVTHLWFSISCTWRSPPSFKLILQWAHLLQQDRTHEGHEGWTCNRSWRNGYKRSWAWYAGRQNWCGKAGMGAREIPGFFLWAKAGVRRSLPAHLEQP